MKCPCWNDAVRLVRAMAEAACAGDGEIGPMGGRAARFPFFWEITGNGPRSAPSAPPADGNIAYDGITRLAARSRHRRKPCPF